MIAVNSPHNGILRAEIQTCFAVTRSSVLRREEVRMSSGSIQSKNEWLVAAAPNDFTKLAAAAAFQVPLHSLMPFVWSEEPNNFPDCRECESVVHEELTLVMAPQQCFCMIS